MSYRITEDMLKAKVEELNKLLGRPETAYTKQIGSGAKSNIGNIHVSYAYGGAELHEMMNDWGGVNTLSRGGYVSKRELYAQVSAMVTGIRLSKNEI